MEKINLPSSLSTQVISFAESLDGKWLAVGLKGNNVVYLYPKILDSFSLPVSYSLSLLGDGGYNRYASAITFLDDKKFVVGTTDGQLFFFIINPMGNISCLKDINMFCLSDSIKERSPISCIAFFPNKKIIIICAENGENTWWHINFGDSQKDFFLIPLLDKSMRNNPFNKGIIYVAFSPSINDLSGENRQFLQGNLVVSLKGRGALEFYSFIFEGVESEGMISVSPTLTPLISKKVGVQEINFVTYSDKNALILTQENNVSIFMEKKISSLSMDICIDKIFKASDSSDNPIFYSSFRKDFVEINLKEETVFFKQERDNIGFGARAEAVFKGSFNNKEYAVKSYGGNFDMRAYNQRYIEKITDREDESRKLENNERVLSEIAFYKNDFSHENILKSFGCFTLLDKPSPYIILELCSQSLLDKIRKPIAIEIKEYLNIFYNIAKGISFLQSKKILHRDIKPNNMLVGFDNSIKISDFDTSVQLKEKESYIMSTKDYTHYLYRSPELFDDEEKCYSSSSEIYALGIVFVESKNNGDFMRDPNDKSQYILEMDIKKDTLNDEYIIRLKKYWDKPACFAIPSRLNDIVQQCWGKDPKRRPTIEQILECLVECLKNTR